MTAFFDEGAASAPQTQEAPPGAEKPPVSRRTLLFGRKDPTSERL
jgi:hypothetical protein